MEAGTGAHEHGKTHRVGLNTWVSVIFVPFECHGGLLFDAFWVIHGLLRNHRDAGLGVLALGSGTSATWFGRCVWELPLGVLVGLFLIPLGH